MQPNYYGMWVSLKEELKNLIVEGDMIHLSDLERTMDEIQSDEKQ